MAPAILCLEISQFGSHSMLSIASPFQIRTDTLSATTHTSAFFFLSIYHEKITEIYVNAFINKLNFVRKYPKQCG